MNFTVGQFFIFSVESGLAIRPEFGNLNSQHKLLFLHSFSLSVVNSSTVACF